MTTPNPDSNQRWLTLAGICTTLKMTPNDIRQLLRQKAIVRIGTGPSARYLDPTPAYAEELQMGHNLYSKRHRAIRDFNSAAMFTLSEVAQIMGWTFRGANKWAYEKNLPFIRVGRFRFYSIETVRNLLWRRDGRRSVSAQKSPFLLSELIEFFWKHYEAESEGMPTNEDMKRDAALERKIARVMRMPADKREAALRDLMQKAATAKSLIDALHGAGSSPS